MSKLTDILLEFEEACKSWQGPGLAADDKVRADIKALFLELIGEDETTEDYAPHNGERLAREQRNSVRDELRAWVRVL